MNIITLPAFGSVIAGQGGIFAAIVRAPQADGAEQPPIAILVTDKAHEFTSAWGEYGQDVDGAKSRIDGKANTDAMAAAGCAAAQKLRGLTIEGHADWYLPSLGELNSAAANAPEAFDPKGVYWTSTQVSRHHAFAQDFEDGYSRWNGKSYEFRVRPFRRIPLEFLIA